MYKRNLEALIKSKQLPRILLLYGACEYQIEFFGLEILNIFKQDDDDIVKIYFDEYNFNSIKDTLAQNSLFGGKNIVSLKLDKPINAKELNAIFEIVHKNPMSYFLVELYLDESKLTSSEKAKLKNFVDAFCKKNQADFARFFKATQGEAMTFLTFYARAKNLQIDHYALMHLYAQERENLALCVAELDKLSILDKNITKNDIDMHVFGLGNINLEDFIIKIYEKQDFRLDFENIIEHGKYEAMDIINSFEKFLSQLFMFNIYIRTHGNPNNINPIEIVGFNMPKFIADKRAALSIKIKLSQYDAIFCELINCEHTLKLNASADKNAILFSTFLRIQSYL